MPIDSDGAGKTTDVLSATTDEDESLQGSTAHRREEDAGDCCHGSPAVHKLRLLEPVAHHARASQLFEPVMWPNRHLQFTRRRLQQLLGPFLHCCASHGSTAEQIQGCKVEGAHHFRICGSDPRDRGSNLQKQRHKRQQICADNFDS